MSEKDPVSSSKMLQISLMQKVFVIKRDVPLCIMSQAKIFDDKAEIFYVCSCSKTDKKQKSDTSTSLIDKTESKVIEEDCPCPPGSACKVDKKKYICKYCFEKCHEGHQATEKKMLRVSEVYCHCALNNHIIKEENKTKVAQKKNECPFSEVSQRFGFEVFGFLKCRNEKYCLGCYKKCLKDKIAANKAKGIMNSSKDKGSIEEAEKEEKILKQVELVRFADDKQYLMDQKFTCCCDSESHKDVEKLKVEALLKIITISDDKFNGLIPEKKNVEDEIKEAKLINKRTILGMIFNKEPLFKDYISSIIELYRRIDNKNVMEQDFTQKIEHLELLRKLIKIHKNDSYTFFSKENMNSYKEEFKAQLFSYILRKNQNGFMANHGKQGFNYYSLYFLRKLFVLPLTRIQQVYDISNDLENITPIHRLFYRIDKDDFFEPLEIFQEKDRKYFFKSIDSLCAIMFDPQEKIEPDRKKDYLYRLIIESLKWQIIKTALGENDKEIRRPYFEKIKEYVQKLEKQDQKENKDDEEKNKEIMESREKVNRIIYYITRLFIAQCISTNDNVFYKFIKSTNTKVADQSELLKDNKFFFLKGGNELQDLFQYIFISKNSKTLTPSVYNLMVNPNDIYIDTIRSFMSSRQKCTSSFFKYLEPGAYDNLRNTDLKQFFESIEHLEKTKGSYYSAILHVNNFCSEVKKCLYELENYVKTLDKEEESAYFTQLNSNQNFVVKSGFFNTLFSLYYIFSTDLYIINSAEMAFKEKKEKEKANEIESDLRSSSRLIYRSQLKRKEEGGSKKKNDVEIIKGKILEIFKKFFKNSFLFPIFIGHKTLKILSYFDKEKGKLTFKEEHLDFYFELFQEIRKKKCKFDFTQFLQIALNIPLEDESHDKVNKLLKILKIIQKINSLYSIKHVNYLICEYLARCKYENYLKPERFEGYSDAEKRRTINILKLINVLHDYYYSTIQEKFPIKNIRKTMEQLFNKLIKDDKLDNVQLLSKSYRVFSSTYSKFYISNPFFIDKKNIPGMKCGQSKELFDSEPNNKISKNEEDKEELKHFETDISNLDNRKDDVEEDEEEENICVLSFLTIRTRRLKKTFQEEDLIDADPKDKEDFLVDTLEPIFKNFEYFQFLMKKIENDDKIIFRTFETLILIPSVFMLYNVLYLSHTVTASRKYLAYKIVYLFLECYRFFIQKVLERYKKMSSNENKDIVGMMVSGFGKINEKLKLLGLISDFFISDDMKGDIKIFLYNIMDCIEIDLEEIKKEPLNIELLLEKYSKFAIGLKKTRFLPQLSTREEIFFKFKEPEEIVVKKKEEGGSEIDYALAQRIFEFFIKVYQEAKSDEKTNYLVDLFTNKPVDKEEFFKNCLKDISSKCNLKCISESDDTTIYYMDRMYSYFKAFDIIAVANPDILQNYFLEFNKNERKAVINNIISQLQLLYQLLFIDYHKMSYKKNKDELFNSAEIFYDIVEFLRLLCENHNQDFQLILSSENIQGLIDANAKPNKDDKKLEKSNSLIPEILILKRGSLKRRNTTPIEDGSDGSSIKFLNFLIKILPLTQDNYEISKEKEQIIKYFKPIQQNYFSSTISKITEFLIEIIQGSTCASKIGKKNPFRVEYFNKVISAFDDFKVENNRVFLFEFLKFIVCYLEEYTITSNEPEQENEKNKKLIIATFNPNKIVFFLKHCTKRLYKEIKAVDERIEDRYREEKKIPIGSSKFLDYSEILLSKYRASIQDESLPQENSLLQDGSPSGGVSSNKDSSEIIAPPNFSFKDNIYFNIGCYASRYLLIAKQYQPSSKITDILNEFSRDDDKEGPTQLMDKFTHWKKESFRFYLSIIKEVEVKKEYSFKEMDINGDIKLADRKDKRSRSRTSKIVFPVHPEVLILDEKEDFDEFYAIAHFDEPNKKLPDFIDYIPRLISQIKFKQNLRLNDSMYRSDFKTSDALLYSAIFSFFVNLVIFFNWRYKQDIDITGASKFTLYREYSTFVYLLNFIHLVGLSFVFLNWSHFQKLKVIRSSEEKSTEVSEKKDNNNGTILEREVLLKVIKDYCSGETFLLAWNFFCVLLPLINPVFCFTYSLQLFTFFGIFQTMKSAVISVKMRYEQFMSSGLLIIILALFFSAIKFNFFCDPTTEECKRFVFCFLTMITGGIRAGSGLNLGMKDSTDKGYYPECFIEWLFYFFVILIMLNVINGIIVDTFQEEREKTNKRNEARDNVCYICGSTRRYFEKIGEDYDKHVKIDHSIINYFQYLLTIIKKDKQELNSLDYSIREQYEKKQTAFFPTSMEERNQKDE